MNIARRLQLLIVVAIVSIFAVGIYSLAQLKGLGERGRYVVDNTMPSYEALHIMATSARYIGALTFKHMLYEQPAEMAAVEKDLVETRERLQSNLDKYGKSLVTNEEDRRLFEVSKQAAQAYLAMVSRCLELSQEGKKREARDYLNTNRITAVNLSKSIEAQVKFNHDIGQDFSNASDLLFQRSLIYLCVAGLVAALLAACQGYFTYRATVGSLKGMQGAVEKITNTLDFTLRAPVLRQDEVGLTATAFNRLIDKIQGSLSMLHAKAGSVNSAAADLAGAAGQVSTSSGYQTDAASNMAASVEEMTVSINHVASRASDTNELAAAAGRAASDGMKVIGEAVDEIHAIAGQIENTSREIGELERKSAQINAVVVVIREVAERTNLLALNAAIEAARAGEQGRGFAVVADEVRKLAERTSSSTQEIADSVSEMQVSAQNSVKAIATVSQHVEKGVEHARAASQAITRISQSTLESVTAVAEINAAIGEQSMAMTSLAQQVEKIAQMTEENNAAAGTAAGTATELDQIAAKMQEVVAEFKVA